MGGQGRGASGPAVPSTYGTVFTNFKGGMEDVDMDHVKRVTYEASLGARHRLFWNGVGSGMRGAGWDGRVVGRDARGRDEP